MFSGTGNTSQNSERNRMSKEEYERYSQDKRLEIERLRESIQDQQYFYNLWHNHLGKGDSSNYRESNALLDQYNGVKDNNDKILKSINDIKKDLLEKFDGSLTDRRGLSVKNAEEDLAYKQKEYISLVNELLLNGNATITNENFYKKPEEDLTDYDKFVLDNYHKQPLEGIIPRFNLNGKLPDYLSNKMSRIEREMGNASRSVEHAKREYVKSLPPNERIEIFNKLYSDEQSKLQGLKRIHNDSANYGIGNERTISDHIGSSEQRLQSLMSDIQLAKGDLENYKDEDRDKGYKKAQEERKALDDKTRAELDEKDNKFKRDFELKSNKIKSLRNSHLEISKLLEDPHVGKGSELANVQNERYRKFPPGNLPSMTYINENGNRRSNPEYLQYEHYKNKESEIINKIELEKKQLKERLDRVEKEITDNENSRDELEKAHNESRSNMQVEDSYDRELKEAEEKLKADDEALNAEASNSRRREPIQTRPGIVDEMRRKFEQEPEPMRPTKSTVTPESVDRRMAQNQFPDRGNNMIRNEPQAGRNRIEDLRKELARVEQESDFFKDTLSRLTDDNPGRGRIEDGYLRTSSRADELRDQIAELEPQEKPELHPNERILENPHQIQINDDEILAKQLSGQLPGDVVAKRQSERDYQNQAQIRMAEELYNRENGFGEQMPRASSPYSPEVEEVPSQYFNHPINSDAENMDFDPEIERLAEIRNAERAYQDAQQQSKYDMEREPFIEDTMPQARHRSNSLGDVPSLQGNNQSFQIPPFVRQQSSSPQGGIPAAPPFIAPQPSREELRRNHLEEQRRMNIPERGNFKRNNLRIGGMNANRLTAPSYYGSDAGSVLGDMPGMGRGRGRPREPFTGIPSNLPERAYRSTTPEKPLEIPLGSGESPNIERTSSAIRNLNPENVKTASNILLANLVAHAKHEPIQPPVSEMFSGLQPEHHTARILQNTIHTNLPNIERAQELNDMAARSFPSVMDEYMHPYNEAITQRLLKQEMENYEENILPALRNRFIHQGRFGGDVYQRYEKNAENAFNERMRAIRENGMKESYNQAQNAYDKDSARWMDISKHENALGNSKMVNKMLDQNALIDAGNRFQEHEQQYLTELANRDANARSGHINRMAPLANYLQTGKFNSVQETRPKLGNPSMKANQWGQLLGTVGGNVANSLIDNTFFPAKR